LCVNGACDEGTGICLNCTSNFFGKYCNESCLCMNETCDEGIFGTGICLNCTPKFGKYCNECSCVNGVCGSNEDCVH